MPLPRPQAILFDLDGTLVDSHASIASAIRATMREHGLPDPTQTALEGAVSLPLRTMLSLITTSSDPTHIDAFAATYLRHYVGTMVELSNPFAGVDTMLDAIAARGLPIAVLTNKTEANAKRICEGRLGQGRFTAIVGAVPGRPTKPDPAGAHLLASRLGVDPLACWLVGDSHVDIDTARAARMSAVGVRWGITESLAAKLTHADVVLDRTEQLVGLVDAACG